MKPYDDDIAHEASSWIARLNSGTFNSDDEKGLRTWLDSSELNRREYQAQISLWQELGAHEAGLMSTVSQEHTESAGDDPQQKPATNVLELPIKRVWRRLSVAATGLVAASLFAGFLIFSGNSPSVSGPQRYLTQKGHQTEALLADKTRIMMNTDSDLVVEYKEQVRHVALQHGEVFFDVAADPDRPFIVETEWGDVRVLGTQFNVLATENGLRVDVLEGLVEIVPNSEVTQAETDVFLKANESLTVARNEDPQKALERETVRDVAPWRDGVLTFYDQPLKDVVEEINRYSNRELRIVSPDLESIAVSGSFNIGDVSAFLEGLEAITPVSIQRRDGAILLRSRN